MPTILSHPETRQTLNRFTVDELQNVVHVELFGEISKDSIKRRLALKCWKGVSALYAAEDKELEDKAPLLSSLLDAPVVEAEEEKEEEEKEVIELTEPRGNRTVKEWVDAVPVKPIRGTAKEAVYYDDAQPGLPRTEKKAKEKTTPPPAQKTAPKKPAYAGSNLLAWASGEKVDAPPEDISLPKPEKRSRLTPVDADGSYRGLIKPCPTCGGIGMHKCCPRCGVMSKGLDEVHKTFGFRHSTTQTGTVKIAQPWCRSCRSEHAKETRKAKEGAGQ